MNANLTDFLTQQLEQTLASEREAAAEQLTAAWQLHIARVEEVLEAGWRNHIQQVFDERFSELRPKLEKAVASAVEQGVQDRLSRQQLETREQASEELTQSARRIRLAEDSDQLRAVVVETAGRYAGRLLYLVVEDSAVLPGGSYGFPPEASRLLDALRVSLQEAPALKSCAETVDSVITLRIATELSAALTDVVGEEPTGKVYLVPIAAGGKVSAILYADGEGRAVSLASLELISHLAAGAAALLAPPPSQTPPALVDGIPSTDEMLHLRAKRMARVAVAEMRLYHAAKVNHGRAGRNLFRQLQSEIEGAREAYRQEFLQERAGFPDYLHTELVNLANDDATVLGSDYPGPLA